MPSLKPNQQRANQAIFIFWILLIGSLFTFISDLMEYILLQKDVVDSDAAETNDTRQMIIGIFYFCAIIVTIILFIKWFRRAYYNLHQVYQYGLSYSEGWAAGSWFVPIMSLFAPYRIMKEIWKKTQETTRGNSYVVDASLIGWWWTFFIVNYLASNSATRLSLRADTLEELRTASTASIISGVIEIPAILITIYLIKKLSRYESEFAASIELSAASFQPSEKENKEIHNS